MQSRRRCRPGCRGRTTGSSCPPRWPALARRPSTLRPASTSPGCWALERDGALFLSGPLLSGPGAGPGSGVTVLRAADQDGAESIAARDPFVLAGLRTFTVHRWRLNEGSIGVRLSLGTGRYDWR